MTAAPVTAVNTDTGEVVQERPALAAVPDPGHGLPLASPTIAQIAGALAKAQRNFGQIKKTKTAKIKPKNGGAEYSYKYADLADVLEAVEPALNAEGIFLMQRTSRVQGGVLATSTLLHESGEWIATSGMHMPLAGDGAQAVGSAITYAKRYDVCGLLGVASDADDDGRTAQGGTSGAQRSNQPKAKSNAKEAITPEQREALVAKLMEGGMPAGAAKSSASKVHAGNYAKSMEKAEKLVAERAAATPAAAQDAAAEATQPVTCSECHGTGEGGDVDGQVVACAACQGHGEVQPS